MDKPTTLEDMHAGNPKFPFEVWTRTGGFLSRHRVYDAAWRARERRLREGHDVVVIDRRNQTPPRYKEGS